MPGTSAGSRTMYSASDFLVPASVMSRPEPDAPGPSSPTTSRAASGPFDGRPEAGGGGPSRQRIHPARARCSTRCRSPIAKSRNLPCRATPAHDLAGQRGGRGIERLERRERHHVEALDGAPVQARPEIAHERVHLRQLRHASSLPPPPDNSSSRPVDFGPKTPRIGPKSTGREEGGEGRGRAGAGGRATARRASPGTWAGARGRRPRSPRGSRPPHARRAWRAGAPPRARPRRARSDRHPTPATPSVRPARSGAQRPPPTPRRAARCPGSTPAAFSATTFCATSVWCRTAAGSTIVVPISSVSRASTPIVSAYCSRPIS